MSKEIRIIGLKGIPLINPGDNIPAIIVNSLKLNNIILEDKDVLVISQTIVSKSNGRIKNLKQIKPSRKAMEYYEEITPKAKKLNLPIKSPELIQVILDESKEILSAEHVLITETKHGFVCANAGVDKSNVEGENNVALLPEHPDEDADKIRKNIKSLTGKDVAVIISDSFGRPFRIGAVGVAVGISGMNPIIDKRGAKDLFGYELQSTIIGQADNLTSAAQLIMGETNEGLPIILIKNYDFERIEKAAIESILREKSQDLFRSLGTKAIFRLFKNRRSYKLKFKDKAVDKDIIKECIDIARWAPSAHNGQFWRYIILEKSSIRKKLIIQMNQKLKIDLEKEGKSELFIQHKINKTKEKFIEAPILVLLCLDTRDLEKYQDAERSLNEYILGVQSISSSATYFLLALSMKDLASCWFCAPLFAKEIVKQELGLPESFVPMAFFTVGYPLESIKAPERKTLHDIIYELKE